MAKNLSLHIDADGVAVLSLHVAGDDHNCFSPGLATDLYAAVAEIGARAEVCGVVLTSARDNGFLAGARLEGLLAGQAALAAPAVAALLAPVHALMRAIETGGKPWVAAINGAALGGGFELCLACHRRLLAPGAEVGLPELPAGLIPGGGGTQRLPRLIGIEAALPLLLQAHRIDAAEALRLGLVDEVLPAQDLVPVARRWVLDQPEATQPWDRKGWRIPGGAGALAPHAVAGFGLNTVAVHGAGGEGEAAGLALLEVVYEGTQLPIDKALALEAKCFAALVTGLEARA